LKDRCKSQFIELIDSNFVFVEKKLIEKEKTRQFERNCYTKYTSEYQKFAFINGTLLINGEDRCGNPIEINITSV